MIFLLAGALLVLAALGAPLFALIAAVALLGFHYAGQDGVAVAVEFYRLADMPALIAIPLFTLAGYVLAESRAPQRMVRVTNALLGWLPGGLAIVAVIACAMFTAFTGATGVTIVANDGGLAAGTVLPDGLSLREHIPQAHKVALVDIPAGGAVRRYDVIIGYALQDIAAGSWVHERLLRMPAARELDGLPIATRKPAPLPPLEGYSFEGYRNPDGSVGTRNILAITTTVQCVAGVLDVAVRRIKAELLPKYPNVDDVVGLEHTYGCGVAIDAPDAVVPIRTLRNIS